MALNVFVKRSILFRSQNIPVLLTANYSSENWRTIDEPKIEYAKRGTGYRSSFSGTICTVFGATGFIGGNIVNRLARDGTQIVVPHRSPLYAAHHLKVAGDLGQMNFTPFDLEDDESIRKAIKYSHVVINCIGKDCDTVNYSLERTHVWGARKIARICREMGIKKFIHVSALNATPNPKVMQVPGGSRFYISKWNGELAVREEFPEAIIVRPSDVYGEFDRFLNYYRKLQRLVFRKLYLWEKGENTIKCPVFGWDVSQGFFELVKKHPKEVAGKTYQFVGPRAYRLCDLLEYLYAYMLKTRDWGFQIDDSRYSLTFRFLMEMKNMFYWQQPRTLLTWERFERENTSDVVDPNLPTLRDLGVKLTNIEDIIWGYTEQGRARSDYRIEVYEFESEAPPPPKIVQEL